MNKWFKAAFVCSLAGAWIVLFGFIGLATNLMLVRTGLIVIGVGLAIVATLPGLVILMALMDLAQWGSQLLRPRPSGSPPQTKR